MRVPVHPSVSTRFGLGTARFVLYPEEVLPLARTMTEDYNTKVRALFVNYLRNYVEKHKGDADFIRASLTLPLSKLLCPAASCECGPGSVATTLKAASQPAGLRSQFLAVRGTGEEFTTVKQAANDLCGGMFVSSSQVRLTCGRARWGVVSPFCVTRTHAGARFR